MASGVRADGIDVLVGQQRAERREFGDGIEVVHRRHCADFHAEALGLHAQFPERQGRPPQLLEFILEDRKSPGLLEKSGVRPRFILDQVRGNDVRLVHPLVKGDVDPLIARRSGCTPQFAHDLQPRIAAHVEHVALGARATGDRQRPLQTTPFNDRVTDFGVARIEAGARIAIVIIDLLAAQAHESGIVRARLDRDPRIADPRGETLEGELLANLLGRRPREGDLALFLHSFGELHDADGIRDARFGGTHGAIPAQTAPSA